VFHFALKIECRQYGVSAKVPGMNCMTPEDPEPPEFVTPARNPDSQRAIASCSRNDTP
jgi:hypothetical protein